MWGRGEAHHHLKNCVRYLEINDNENLTILETNDESLLTLYTNEKETKRKEEENNFQNLSETLNLTNSPKKKVFVKAKQSFSCQLCHENFSNKIELVQHEKIHFNKHFTPEEFYRFSA